MTPIQKISLLLFSLLISITCIQVVQGQKKNMTFVWSIQPNSSIEINGSSNVNTFGCASTGSFKTTPIQGTTSSGTVKLKGSISIAINQLDCNNKMLNKDLRKTLKADQYPTLTIRFLDLERMPLTTHGDDVLSGTVEIELAGKRKNFTLRYSLTKTNQGFLLEGGRAFTFSDFDLSPPKKIGGLIKVKDNFDVNFSLNLKG